MRDKIKNKVEGKLTMQELDNLTGVLSKNSVEKRISNVLMNGGALFVCDIDHFRRVNDQFGHLAGDECLKQTARTLGFMIRKNDILGRIGGDEFVIFMPGAIELNHAENFKLRIEERFHSDRRKENKGIGLSVSIGYSVYERGDNYNDLLKKAWDNLRLSKNELHNFHKLSEEVKDNYWKDAKQVKNDLMEQIRKPGAYCQNYETFKSIYRFLERGMIRSNQKVCVILLTIVDSIGNMVLPDEKDSQMEHLGEVIQNTLRMGDVYTRYTSCQYLILAIDTTEILAERIAERIKNYYLTTGGNQHNLLVYNCYELQSAKIIEK